MNEIIQYYKDEKNEKGSGQIPSTKLYLNALFSGNGGLEIRFVYEVKNYNSFTEFKQAGIRSAQECIERAKEYRTIQKSVTQWLRDYSNQLPIGEYHTFRKAPALHHFFLNHSEPNTDHSLHQLDIESLKELKSRAEQALKEQSNVDLLESLFPFAEGVFFGEYEYDDYFFEYLQDAINMVDKILKVSNLNDLEIYYEYDA